MAIYQITMFSWYYRYLSWTFEFHQMVESCRAPQSLLVPEPSLVYDCHPYICQETGHSVLQHVSLEKNIKSKLSSDKWFLTLCQWYTLFGCAWIERDWFTESTLKRNGSLSLNRVLIVMPSWSMLLLMCSANRVPSGTTTDGPAGRVPIHSW